MDKKKWDSLSLRSKVEYLGVVRRFEGKTMFNTAALLMLISTIFVMTGLAIYFPYLENNSFERASLVVGELFRASKLLTFLALGMVAVSLLFVFFRGRAVRRVVDND